MKNLGALPQGMGEKTFSLFWGAALRSEGKGLWAFLGRWLLGGYSKVWEKRLSGYWYGDLKGYFVTFAVC